MKESNFINRNKDKWQEYEDLKKSKAANPSKLSRLFLQITDDLSYARTFYRNRQVRLYLNTLAQELFVSVNKGHRVKRNDFFKFWRYTLPLAMYQIRKELLFTFLLFAVCVLIGALSAAKDPDFSKMILSDEYVQQTLENIKNGDPMGVYKKSSEFNMMFGITLNNLLVSIMTFVLGIFAAIGSVVMIVYNGVMVGTFQYFFIERGLFWESFLTIWQHGTLEISSIIIAGSSGIVLGKGLLFPRIYTRMQSFKLSARKALVVLSGILPIIVLAAFIESFFTRYTDLPDVLRLMVILLSLTFMLGYFVIYPYRLSKKGNVESKEQEVLYEKEDAVRFHEISSGADIFEKTLRLLYNHSKRYFKTVLLFGLGYVGFYWLINYLYTDSESIVYKINPAVVFAYYNNAGFLSFLLNVVSQTILTSMFFSFYDRYKQSGTKNKLTIKIIRYINVLFAIILINIALQIDSGFKYALLVLLMPILMMLTFTACAQDKFILAYVFKSLGFIKNEVFKTYGVFLKFMSLTILFLLLMQTQVFDQILEIFQMSVFFKEQGLNIYVNLLIVFLSSIVIFFFLVQSAISCALLYYSIHEKRYADELKNKILKLGEKQKIIGYERE